MIKFSDPVGPHEIRQITRDGQRVGLIRRHGKLGLMVRLDDLYRDTRWGPTNCTFVDNHKEAEIFAREALSNG